MSLDRTIAHDLLSIEAVFLRPDEPFTWASGIKSPIYCDNRLTLTAPAVRTHVEEGLVDLISTGGSCIEVVEALREAGAEVLGIVSIFTYGLQKGLDRMAAADVKNYSLSNFDAVCEVAADEGNIRPEDIERLKKFRSNPSDESWIG